VGGSRTPLLAKVPVSVLRLALLFSLGHALRVPLSAALLLCDPRSAVAFCLVTRSAYHSCWLFLAPRSAATSLGYALRVAFVYLFFSTLRTALSLLRGYALRVPQLSAFLRSARRGRFCVDTRSAFHRWSLLAGARLRAPRTFSALRLFLVSRSAPHGRWLPRAPRPALLRVMRLAYKILATTRFAQVLEQATTIY
jgi:hypothetical protein